MRFDLGDTSHSLGPLSHCRSALTNRTGQALHNVVIVQDINIDTAAVDNWHNSEQKDWATAGPLGAMIGASPDIQDKSH